MGFNLIILMLLFFCGSQQYHSGNSKWFLDFKFEDPFKDSNFLRTIFEMVVLETELAAVRFNFWKMLDRLKLASISLI